MNAIEEYRLAVQDLEALGVMPERAPSLEPMREGLKRIGFRGFEPARVIVVAGTNGKGSVCAILEALLQSAGERVGLYTSPHLIETTERFRRAGQDLDPTAFVLAYRGVRARVGDLKLSHFEMLTLMAVWEFISGEAAPPVDRLILETGLGGTWDATNAIPHEFCIITRLGLDHQNLLGQTLSEIARNKFGIVPRRVSDQAPGARVVHAPLPPEVRALAASIQVETGSKWISCIPFECEVTAPVTAPGGEPGFFLRTEYGLAPLSLPGGRGCENAALALTAFRELGYEPDRHLPALSRVRWPGRMQRVKVSGTDAGVYLSGDHNPQGMESLIELLRHYPHRSIHFVVGIGKDKDADSMLDLLRDLPGAKLYQTVTPFKGRAREEGMWEHPEDAFRAALSAAGPDDLVIVTGSLYLVGAIQRFLN